MGTCRHQHRAIGYRENLAQSHRLDAHRRRDRQVELDTAGHRQCGRRQAQCEEALTIGGGLAGHGIELLEHGGYQPGQASIAARRTRRQAGVQQQHTTP